MLTVGISISTYNDIRPGEGGKGLLFLPYISSTSLCIRAFSPYFPIWIYCPTLCFLLHRSILHIPLHITYDYLSSITCLQPIPCLAFRFLFCRPLSFTTWMHPRSLHLHDRIWK